MSIRLTYGRMRLLIVFMIVIQSNCVIAQNVSMKSSPIELPEEAEAPDVHHFVHRAMGTEFTLMITMREGDVGRDDLAPVATEAFDAIDMLEHQISSWIAASDTSRVNRFAGKRAVEVRSDTYVLFGFSAQTYRDTNGAFDITVGPLIDLWRTSSEQGTSPAASAIAETLKLTGMDRVRLDSRKRTVHLLESGMKVSFGGIGKGLALDRARGVLERFGVNSALLIAGDSSIYALGAPSGKDFWKISIHNPYNSEGSLGDLLLRDEALSTSACYGGVVEDADDVCDILDPTTGNAVSGMMSATVVAPSGMQTDALSTAFFVMGVDGAAQYCKSHENVKAVLFEIPKNDVPSPHYIGRWSTKQKKEV